MIEWQIRRACRILASSGVIAYPTETVYGLGCDPDDDEAIARLLAIKQRPWGKGLIIIGHRPRVLYPYLSYSGKKKIKKKLKSAHHPVTWLFRASDRVSPLLRGTHDTIAVRLTTHPVAIALCRRYGKPIVSTSANVAGRAPKRREFQLRRDFGKQVDYVVPGKAGPYRRPSEIRDARSGKVLRAG